MYHLCHYKGRYDGNECLTLLHGIHVHEARGKKVRLLSESVYTKKDNSMQSKSRTRKLFFSVEPEVAKYNDYLAEHGNPEQWEGHWTTLKALREVPTTGIGKH